MGTDKPHTSKHNAVPAHSITLSYDLSPTGASPRDAALSRLKDVSLKQGKIGTNADMWMC
jgi:hypothetical protein